MSSPVIIRISMLMTLNSLYNDIKHNISVKIAIDKDLILALYM